MGWIAGAGMAGGMVLASVRTPSFAAFVGVSIGLALLIVVSLVDVLERRIPDHLTYPAIATCLGVAAVASRSSAVSALVGAAVFTLILLVPHLLRPDAMGRGDVKLAFPLGFAIGWARGDAIEVVIAVGWTVAAASIVGLLIAALARRRSIAFGPPLSVATAVVLAIIV